MSDQTTAVQLAILASGAYPRLDVAPLPAIPDPATNPVPPNSGGYELNGATRAQITVALQLNSGKRRAVFEFQTVDLATTYAIALGTGGAPSETYDAAAGAPADEAELLEQWRDTINDPGSALTGYVVATVEEGRLVVTHRAGGSPFRMTSPSSTVAITMTTEYDTARVQMYSRSAALVSISDTATATEARLYLSGWQMHYQDGALYRFDLEDGNGLRGLVECQGLAAILPIIGNASGAADDLVTLNGSPSSSSLLYFAPWVVICPCVVGPG